MTDERERAYGGPPVVTPEREAAWEQWKDDYLTTCINGWVNQGATREQIQAAGAVVIVELSEVDDLPWMPLGHALVQRFNSLLSKGPLEGDAKREYVRGLRTAETSTKEDRTLALAYHMGVTVQQAANMRDSVERANHEPEPVSTGECSLYRHFDHEGVLLYIGIANEPDRRAEQHRYHSEWFRFVDSTTVEWHPSREVAHEAERDAIKAERPVFNLTHNRAHTSTAVNYLFRALREAAEESA